ncbi:MAG: class I SAM-dependent methyltransferase [Candidatus Xenobium sp.]
MNSSRSEVLVANIAFHSAIADRYDAMNPHTGPENASRVERVLLELRDVTGGTRLLDLGCGTGFIIGIAKAHFDLVAGLDATTSMLEQVDTSILRPGGQVRVQEGNSESIPHPDGSFDVCTGYSFLHHLYNLEPTLREAHRVLAPGGRVFFGLEPNLHFWRLVRDCSSLEGLSPIVAREVEATMHISHSVAEEVGVSEATVGLAEFQKIEQGGFDPKEICGLLERVGFVDVEARYDWYLGQGEVTRTRGPQESDMIERYLREGLPATRSLFKYLSFFGTRA